MRQQHTHTAFSQRLALYPHQTSGGIALVAAFKPAVLYSNYTDALLTRFG